jgi:hypothetical protein
VRWLKANPAPVLTAIGALFGIIVAIAAIIAIDTTIAKTIGSILFSLIAVIGFIASGLWAHTNSKQMSISILSALMLAIGAGVFIWAKAPVRNVDVVRYVDRKPPTTITINQPTPGAMVGPRPDITGSVTHLAATQFVWMFSEPFSTNTPFRPLQGIGPYEQCETYNNRTRFRCSHVFNGSPNGDYCRRALLWVSVVDGRQADYLRGAARQGSHLPRTWPNPPYVGASSDYVFVQRNPHRESVAPVPRQARLCSCCCLRIDMSRMRALQAHSHRENHGRRLRAE